MMPGGIPGVTNSGSMPISANGGPSSAKGQQDGTFRTGNITFGAGMPWWVVALIIGGVVVFALKK
ncbi:hypothetical protein [Photobacterium atrarenae]|uniref:GlyGly-CTERM sorting domain-containing protein n=1 Tax=Photobacterium atrarenae TaxID=865757 RepID=A0ABY5GE95_9GAMM|nr:hypothetical protein [Photobacterium atrarenae]UTV27501.1 hypothetical protein NNL38_14490 [Photobacterium atrarenae]